MEKENFFTKLRRVAASTESETVRLKACMERPVAVRSSSSTERDGTSPRLALKEMQYDVTKMKEKAQEQIKVLSTSSNSFVETLDACESLFDVTRQQVTDLEFYLEQYGYKKYKEPTKEEPQHKNQRKSSKEDMEQDTSVSSATMDASETPDENVPCTPPKDPSSSHGPVDLDKTPQLADFGVSQWTMDRLAHVGGMNGSSQQDMKTEHFSGYQYGSVSSAVPSQAYLSTPQNSHRLQHHTPFTNRTIMVTPGMFGNRLIPTQTPSQFIDTKSYVLDSPIPPVLMSCTKKGEPTTSDLRITHRRDMGAASPEPKPPRVTSWAESIPPPAPPPQLHVPVPLADVTPPMPPCLAPQASQLAPMPAEPTRLAERFTSAATSALPCEPVQLSQQFTRSEELPPEPVQLVEKFASRRDHSPVEPVQLLEKFGSEFKTVQAQQRLNGAREKYAPRITGTTSSLPSGHPQPFTPKGHQRLTTLTGDGDMPQTPELTLTYQRFVDIKSASTGPAPPPLEVPVSKSNQTSSSGQADSPAPPVVQSAVLHDNRPESYPTAEVKQFEHAIPPVTAAEFSQVADYLQRLIPMDVINQKLQDINAMLANKHDTSFISESEMLTLRLGSKTKAFTLLLAKLRRLYMGKNPNSGEPVFFVVK